MAKHVIELSIIVDGADNARRLRTWLNETLVEWEDDGPTSPAYTADWVFKQRKATQDEREDGL
jgi:hypothetical protein